MVILYFGSIEGGTEATLLFCIHHAKPYKLIDADEIPAARAAFMSRGPGMLSLIQYAHR